MLRVNDDEEYRVSLDDGFEKQEAGGGMKVGVLNDEPWRMTHTKQTPGGDS